MRRPGLMILSLVLMILAALPFLFFGAALLLVVVVGAVAILLSPLANAWYAYRR